jgi:hypothetical protein
MAIIIQLFMEATMSKDPLMILSSSNHTTPASTSIPIWSTLATAAAMLMVGAMVFV